MFNTILVAVDVNDPDGAARTVKAAVNMTRTEGATLHVLNVVPDAGMAMVGNLLSPDHAEKMVEAAKSSLESWAASAIPADIDAKLQRLREQQAVLSASN